MKAMVWTNYGSPDVLRLREVKKPTPRDNEVLVKIHAATVTAGDCEIRSLKIPLLFRLPIRLYVGFRKPQRITILGQELAGEIEATGREVTRFKKGDQVFAATFFRFGAYAEYACLPETQLVLKPSNATYRGSRHHPYRGHQRIAFLESSQYPGWRTDFDQRRRREHRYVCCPDRQDPRG